MIPRSDERSVRTSPAPKSISTIRPPASRITFCALMSRCTRPALCTAATARQTSMPISAASWPPSTPRAASSCFSVRPSTHSIHRPTAPSCCSAPYTVTTFGWRTRASRRPSRMTAPVRLAARKTLRATSRSSAGSHARCTVPNRPSPILRRSFSGPQAFGTDWTTSVVSSAFEWTGDEFVVAISARSRNWWMLSRSSGLPAIDSSRLQSTAVPVATAAASCINRVSSADIFRKLKVQSGKGKVT